MEDTNNKLVRLPLWRNALEELLQSGVHHGQTITADWFAVRLKCDRDSMAFGLAVSEIRRELEKLGYYLSGRGQKGNQFVILPPASNADVMENYSHAAIDALKRGVILGTSTRLDLLNTDERRRHEALLERIAIKAALMQRSNAIGKAIKETHPELLNGRNDAQSAA